MALRRMSWSASCLAMCLAFPSLADEQLLLPPLPDPAEVVITAADGLSEPDFVAMLPPVPEAAPVVIDIAAEPSQGTATAQHAEAVSPVLDHPALRWDP
ncbi:MAG: hypothetical protein ACRCUE_09790, partial [Bosea sp. (in: a-proteobacteria)]